MLRVLWLVLLLTPTNAVFVDISVAAVSICCSTDDALKSDIL
jgi:hypothetical protein